MSSVFTLPEHESRIPHPVTSNLQLAAISKYFATPTPYAINVSMAETNAAKEKLGLVPRKPH
jgi:hypothetical protein